MYNIRKKLMIQSRENLVTDGPTYRRPRVISQDAVRMSSVQKKDKKTVFPALCVDLYLRIGTPVYQFFSSNLL